MSTIASAPKVEPTWSLRPPVEPDHVMQVSQALRVPPLLASIIIGRGLDENLDSLRTPRKRTRIKTIEAAAERIVHAIKKGERILIHGDYDADGITGSSTLHLALKRLGAKVEVYIPDRFENGYGLNMKFVPQHASRCDLFVSVDCGITGVEETAALKEAGVDVIITDHHTAGDTLPDTLIVHPDFNPETPHGTPQLTGAGVAYHLAWAVHELMGEDEPVDLIEIATIGTIADVVPLLGENRALVREGLKRIPESPWPGIRALMRAAFEQADRPVTARDVAFMLAPRINAAGRLGRADAPLDLLTSENDEEATRIAGHLNEWNTERRAVQDEMFEQALPKVDSSKPAIVIHDDAWHPGIMGIVASKLVETYYKPVFISAQGKGSVRSVPGISALEALKHAAPHLEGFGGHVGAAGFSIDSEKHEAFADAICEYTEAHPAQDPEITLEGLLTPSEATASLWEALCNLEPFGEGHPAPNFGIAGPLGKVRAVGKEGRHLQLAVSGVKGISFGNGSLADDLSVGAEVTLAAALQENEWRGKRSIEFMAEHVRPHEALRYQGLNGATPTRVFRGAKGHQPTLDALVVTQDPFSWTDLVHVTDELSEKVQAAPSVFFHLPQHDLERIEKNLLLFPTLADLRVTLVARRRGKNAPQDKRTERACASILQEVELLDETGAPTKRRAGHPFDSSLYQRVMAQQYVVSEFLKAYRFVDDASFEKAVQTLFAPPS